MQPKIFLSHNFNDKPVVEPIAIRLKDIFGQENVFYDAWSIQPGDGIIQKMNEGLSAPDFVFFFVSDVSLKSKMVELEWQNALYASTKGNVRIIPIRVDGTPMPAILMQNLWIDLHTQGVEAAIMQIVNVIQGNNTFTPQNLGFSNLTYRVMPDSEKSIIIEVAASHLMEPSTMIAIITPNTDDDITCELQDGSPHIGGFNPKAFSRDNLQFNAFAISRMSGAITPKLPMQIRITAKTTAKIFIEGVMHRVGTSEWAQLPMKTL
jgi:hypothetical protein